MSFLWVMILTLFHYEALWIDSARQAERETYLRTLAADFNRCWRAADKGAERGIASAYDEVKRSLVDLSDAYALCSTPADFDRRLD